MAGLVIDHTRFRGALRRRHLPGLRGSRHEHRTACRARAAQDVVVHRNTEAAAGELSAIQLRVRRCLLGVDLLPVHIELLRDHLREGGLDALPDLGVLGEDRDGVIRSDLNVRIQGAGGRCRLSRGRLDGRYEAQIQQESTACSGTPDKEGTPGNAIIHIRCHCVIGCHVQMSRESVVGRPAACLMAARMRV